MVDYVRGRGMPGTDFEQPLDLQACLRGMTSGDWRNGEAEQSAVAIGSGTGGSVVPVLLASSILDRARASSTVVRSGAQFYP